MNKKGNLFTICFLVSIIFLTSFFLANISYAADSNTVSQEDIITSSKSLHNYINKNDKLPETINVSNKKLSSEQFLYLMSKTIINKKNNIKSNITIKYNIKKAPNPSGSNINGKIYYNDMCNYSKRLINFINQNNRTPNYITTNLGRMQYDTIVFTFSKYLSQTNSSGKLASQITVSSAKKGSINNNPTNNSSINNSSTNNTPVNNSGYTTSLFNKYQTGDSLQKYLVSTKNAPANSTYIKELANQITKGCTTNLSKAEAIFNWVKNNIKYSGYGNTKYGGETTIKQKKGNCVDNSHALVSLLRASKIPARYVNGKCDFTKGELANISVAHVWVQVLIGNQWMVADGIYKGNRLGYVTNWKPNTYKLYGIYSSI